jgi:hypothetical protein
MACWAVAEGSTAVAGEEVVGTGLGGTGRPLETLSAAESAHAASRAVDPVSAYGEIVSVVTTNATPASRSTLATEGTLILSRAWLGSIRSSNRVKVRK